MFLYCKFYRSLRFVHGIISGGIDIEGYLLQIMTNVAYSFQGGVSYFELKQTNIYEIYLLSIESNRINRDIDSSIKRGS